MLTKKLQKVFLISRVHPPTESYVEATEYADTIMWYRNLN